MKPITLALVVVALLLVACADESIYSPEQMTGQHVIAFQIPTSSDVVITISTMTGYEIWRHEHHYEAGSYTVTWDFTDQEGGSVKEGLYRLSLTAGYWETTQTVILLKEETTNL